MNIQILQTEKIAAMKSGDTFRKNAISNMIDQIQKATITSKGRIELTDTLVDECLIKYQKTIQEMVDTCPASYADRLATYSAELNIVKEFAPQLISDAATIETMLRAMFCDIEFTKKNKGFIMKTLSGSEMKTKVDMKVVNQVLTSILV